MDERDFGPLAPAARTHPARRRPWEAAAGAAGVPRRPWPRSWAGEEAGAGAPPASWAVPWAGEEVEAGEGQRLRRCSKPALTGIPGVLIVLGVQLPRLAGLGKGQQIRQAATRSLSTPCVGCPTIFPAPTWRLGTRLGRRRRWGRRRRGTRLLGQGRGRRRRRGRGRPCKSTSRSSCKYLLASASVSCFMCMTWEQARRSCCCRSVAGHAVNKSHGSVQGLQQ